MEYLVVIHHSELQRTDECVFRLRNFFFRILAIHKITGRITARLEEMLGDDAPKGVAARGNRRSLLAMARRINESSKKEEAAKEAL